ncbi:MAG: hypothetical protein C3F02_03110 [Parcubacteria group bacterium]|nr:MAG: hypothetical protein C3F02_03110 [Parcubacteria group bacterium]
MKKLVTISLFIFWAVVTAILTAGLVFRKDQPINPVNPPTSDVPAGGQILDAAAVARHNFVRDCWLIINSKVYNVTNYLSAHPGGVATITPYCGQEATRAFDTRDQGRPHSNYANSLLVNYYIGDFNQTVDQAQLDQNTQNTNSVIPRGDDGEDD